MKRSLLRIFVVIVLWPVSVAMAQSDMQKKIKIGLSLTPVGVQDVGPKETLDGGGSTESSGLFGMGAVLQYSFNHKWSLETGLEFSRQRIVRTGAFHPAEPAYEGKSTLKIWELPVMARFNFVRFLYVNGGLMFHVDGSGKGSEVDKQDGVGLQAGLGANIRLGNGFSVFVNPMIKRYSVLHFQDHGNYPDRVLSGNVKLGVMYRLN